MRPPGIDIHSTALKYGPIRSPIKSQRAQACVRFTGRELGEPNGRAKLMAQEKQTGAGGAMPASPTPVVNNR